MLGFYSKNIRFLNVLGDGILLNASFIVSFLLTLGDSAENYLTQYFYLLLFFNAAWLAVGFFLETYHIYRVTRDGKVYGNILKFLLFHFILVEAYIGVMQATYYSSQFVFNTYLLAALLIPMFRALTLVLIRRYRRQGNNTRRVVIAGIGSNAKPLKSFFDKHAEFGYRFVGFFDNHATHQEQVIGKVAQLENFVLEHKIDEIYASLDNLSKEEVNRLIMFADNNMIRIKFITDSESFHFKRFKIDFYDDIPVLILRSTPLDELPNSMLKRAFDVAFSSFVILTVLSWLMPLLALIIAIDSRGPIFFLQKRSGIDNKDFWCFKLRTMYVNRQATFKQATKNDPRITRIGRFLRKSNLDELPQFFNVLKGDMSIIGPRPHPVEMTKQYSKVIDKYMVRHYVKPGITGLSQVKGYRGETQERVMMRNRIKMDIFYLENWSFFFDLKITFLTVLNMIKGEENAY